MDERVASLEAVVANLTDRVADLEARLARVDHRAAVLASSTDSPHDPLTAVGEIGAASVQQWMALVGRTLVILGGAYLLRATTDSHVFAPPLGVAIGLMYGAPWLLLASRAEGRGAHLDALCHALSTALIGYPLVWEATLRFHVLTPTQSAGLLAALTGAAFVLASRRQLQSLAWVVMFGALGSALGLAATTSAWVPYTLLSIGVGLATLWLGYLHRWVELRWPAAFVANFMLFVATGRAGAHGGIATVVWLQALLVIGYLGSFTARTVVGSHRVVPFEVVQSAGAIAVGLGGAVYLLSDSTAGLQIVAAICLLLAGLAYAGAFGFSERRRPAPNFVFQSMVALFFAAAALAIGLPPWAAASGLALLGAVMLGLARTHHRLTLAVHAVIYALGAAALSNLLANATLALATPAAAGVSAPGAASLASLALLAAVLVLPVRDTRERWPYVMPIARTLVAAAGIWAAGGTVVASVLTSFPGALDPSQLSTLRTIVLVAGAVAAAAAATHPAGREVSWLTYPVLLIVGLKLMFVDFIQGRPTTLFAALAVYGVALIVAPRLLRREMAAPAGAPLPIIEARQQTAAR